MVPIDRKTCTTKKPLMIVFSIYNTNSSYDNYSILLFLCIVFYFRCTKMFNCLKEVRDHLENQLDTDDEITKTRKFKELMELLKKMQECGQPPEELLRDVADGNPMPDNMGQCNLM